MPSTLFLTKQESYRAQRSASQGAGVTLVSGCGKYTATFDCARHVASVLGSRDLQDVGDGLLEEIPVFHIPTEDMHGALSKLINRFSVALIELVVDQRGTRFALVWKIGCVKGEVVTEKVLTLEDF